MVTTHAQSLMGWSPPIPHHKNEKETLASACNTGVA